jgi:catechol 2,3-dioxygenase-like lactoylglutathione lyase family enzyme
MLKLAIPLLRVSSATAAEDFYCNRLGFRKEFEHRNDDSKPEPRYLGLTRDRVWLHVSSFSGDGVPGAVANFMVEDVDLLHMQLVAKGVPIDTGPVNQSWGTRELYVRDWDGNSLRFIQQ